MYSILYFSSSGTRKLPEMSGIVGIPVHSDFLSSHLSNTSSASPIFPTWQWFSAWSFAVKMRADTDLHFVMHSPVCRAFSAG